MKRQSILFFIFLFIFTIFFTIDTTPVFANTPHCGTIDSNEVWSSSGNVHVVTCNVIVSTGVKLTIEEGAIVKFNAGTSLIINGTLDAQGTATDKIYLTSYWDDTVGGDTNGDGSTVGARDDWDRIEFTAFSSDASIIDHAVIRYAGSGYSAYYAAIKLIDSSPTIQNTEITQNKYCAIEANLRSFPTMNNNNIHHNDANGFCIKSGTLDIDATWNLTGIVYYIRNTVTIATDKTLTINPDVIIKFADNGDLIVNGTLKALGSEDDLIYFTSYRDDNVGGDTNGDGATFGARSDWDRIEFTEFSSDASIIDHSVIRYAGTGYSSYYGGIRIVKSAPTIQNSFITENESAGIQTIESNPTLVCNNIYNNAKFGLENKTVSMIVSAQNQWWGTYWGPYHLTLNPLGTGNAVSNGVNFIPWLYAPCIQ